MGLSKNGVPMGRKKFWTDDKVATLTSLGLSGYNEEQIAVEMGIKKSTIMTTCGRLGITLSYKSSLEHRAKCKANWRSGALNRKKNK